MPPIKQGFDKKPSVIRPTLVSSQQEISPKESNSQRPTSASTKSLDKLKSSLPAMVTESYKAKASTMVGFSHGETKNATGKHSKAVDPSHDNKTASHSSLIIGILFGLAVILAFVLLAYKKLQDIWAKRHYDKMDFLIDGMYDL